MNQNKAYCIYFELHRIGNEYIPIIQPIFEKYHMILENNTDIEFGGYKL